MEKLKKCKTCGKDIAKSAKVCPHCGAKNKRKSKLIGVLAILGLIISIIWGISDANEGVKRASSMEGQIGIVNNTELYEINVISLKKEKAIRDTFIETFPSEGGIFVTVLYEYKNISDKPIEP